MGINSTTKMERGFYRKVKRSYGTNKTKLLRNYSKCVKRTSSLVSSRIFLLKCRKHALIPNFISNTTKHVNKLLHPTSKYLPKLNNIITAFHQKVLNIYIQYICTQTHTTQEQLYTLQEEIINTLPFSVADDFLLMQKRYGDKQYTLKTHTHNKKFDGLYEKMMRVFNVDVDEKSFINLTNITVSTDIKWMLSMGPKFALPHEDDDFPLFNVITDCEEVIKGFNDTRVKDIIRAKIANIVLNKTNTHTHNKSIQNTLIKQIHNNTIRFHRKHKDILIIRADKGKATVLMFKSEYEKKVNELLTDKYTYKKIDNDPTEKLQAINNVFTRNLEKLKIISKHEKYGLTTYNTSSPKLYALPKIHKIGIPMRPVVASINTPSSKTSKMLADILQNAMNFDAYNIKNSFEFKRGLSNIKIEDSETMVSFDVVSLFTNIPVNLAITIIEEEWHTITQKTSIPRDLFFSMLRFCLIEANYFTYNSVVYRQIFGMPMGNPLSTIIADIVTHKLLQVVLGELPFTPKIFVKYVDDIFAIIPNNKMDVMLAALNGFHSKLQFTVELERDGVLPYLDVLVLRKPNGFIKTDWYQKDIASKRILNYYSHHPNSQIINTASNLINRVLHLSSPEYHNKNIKIVRKTLTLNNYPTRIINKLINTESNKYETINTHLNITPTQKSSKIYKSMTYVKGISEQISNVIKVYSEDVQLAYKSKNSLNGVFSKLKDPIPQLKKTNVVYRIPCMGNVEFGEKCAFSYIGQTKQYLERRIRNHEYDLRKSIDASTPKTALMDHYHSAGHYPDFKATKVIDTQQHYGKRLTLEALHIYTHDNTINLKRDCDDVSQIYCAILDIHSTRKRKRNDTHTHLTPTHTHHHTNIFPPPKRRRYDFLVG